MFVDAIAIRILTLGTKKEHIIIQFHFLQSYFWPRPKIELKCVYVCVCACLCGGGSKTKNSKNVEKVVFRAGKRTDNRVSNYIP